RDAIQIRLQPFGRGGDAGLVVGLQRFAQFDQVGERSLRLHRRNIRARDHVRHRLGRQSKVQKGIGEVVGVRFEITGSASSVGQDDSIAGGGKTCRDTGARGRGSRVDRVENV